MTDIIDKMKEYDRLPQLKLLSKINNLRCSYFVYQRNYKDLFTLLESIERPEIAIPLWDIRKRKRLNELFFEISRLLHNYLSAAQTLVDHTRIFVKDVYKEHPFEKTYEEEVEKKLSKQRQRRFIQKLRNYCLHNKLPLIGASLSFDSKQGDKISHSIYLDKSSLMKWEGWDIESRAYLQEQSDKIDLKQILFTYYDVISVFYKWFDEQIKNNHRNEFVELDNQRKAIIKEMEKEGLTDFD